MRQRSPNPAHRTEQPKTELVWLGIFLFLIGLATLGLTPAVREKAVDLASRAGADDDTSANVNPSNLGPKPMVTTWFPHAPLFADIDGDGTREVIGLAWDTQNRDQAAIVALDRKTFTARWRTNTYPAGLELPIVHLLVVGRSLVFTDAAAKTHILDLRTGKEQHTIWREGGVVHACPVNDGQHVVLNGTHSPATREMFDVRTGELAADFVVSPDCDLVSQSLRRCESDTPRCLLAADRSLDRLAKSVGFLAKEVLAENDTRLSRGHIAGEGSRTIGIGWDARGTTLLWESPLAVDGDRELTPGEAALGNGSVLFVYASSENGGHQRVVSRSWKTGARIFTADIPYSKGATNTAITIDGDEVFVVSGEILYVLDAKTGSMKKRIAVISSS